MEQFEIHWKCYKIKHRLHLYYKERTLIFKIFPSFHQLLVEENITKCLIMFKPVQCDLLRSSFTYYAISLFRWQRAPSMVLLPPQSGWMPCYIVVSGEIWGYQTSASSLLFVGWYFSPVRSLKSSWPPTRTAMSRCDPGWISQPGSALCNAHWLTSPQLGSCWSEMLCGWSDDDSPSVPECHLESQDAGKRAFAEVV